MYVRGGQQARAEQISLEESRPRSGMGNRDKHRGEVCYLAQVRCLRVCMHTHTHTHTRTHTQTHAHTNTRTHTPQSHTRAHIHIHTYNTPAPCLLPTRPSLVVYCGSATLGSCSSPVRRTQAEKRRLCRICVPHYTTQRGVHT